MRELEPLFAIARPRDPLLTIDWDAARAALGVDLPDDYAPEQLLPWGNDDSGNQLWWLMECDWPVVANEARGEGWERYDGAVAMLTGLVTGRLESEFLTIEDIGEGFVPHVNWDD